MYVLPESITVFNAEELLDSLNKHIQGDIYEQGKSDTVSIDAKDLVDIDGAGLQLLLSVYKTCELKNLSFKMVGINEEIAMLLEITGTKDVLGEESNE
jgi:anti-anti-sigma factor